MGCISESENRYSLGNRARLDRRVLLNNIHWEDRDSVVRAIVLSDSQEILLGAIPLEEMDLIVDPQKLKVIGANGDKPILRI